MAVTINIPSQVRTFANLAAFPATGAVKTIYIAEDTNKTYRWTGSVYVEISGADFSGFVPTSRTLTINGVAQDLSADRSWTISTGLTIGTTPISSGTIGRVLFEGTGNVLQQSGNLFWNNTTNRLGIGTATPTAPIHILYNPASQNGINIDATANNVNHIGFLREGALYGRFGINASSGEFRWDCGAGLGSYFATIYTGNAERLRIFTDGNLGLNTSTNAGFRLDVNGTARVTSSLRVESSFSALSSATIGGTTLAANAILQVNGSGKYVNYNSSFSSGSFLTYQAFGTWEAIGADSPAGTILAFGGYRASQWTGITFHSNGSERMRIKSTGVINMSSVPTSAAGLSAGDIWNDAGTLKIV
jgi:hypothetical protein